MASEHCRRVRQRVGMKGRPAGDKPPRLDKPRRTIDPRRGYEARLSREVLRGPGERRVEARIAGARRLLANERHLAGSRGTTKVVGEAEQEAQRRSLVTGREIIAHRRRQLRERFRTATHSRPGNNLNVVVARFQQSFEGGQVRPARLIRRRQSPVAPSRRGSDQIYTFSYISD